MTQNDYTPPAADFIFAQERRFAGTQQRLWEVWTIPEHLEQWWGPAGMKLIIKRLDLEAGKDMLYGMQGPMGTMWGKFVYVDIKAPNRLSYIVSFCNEEGIPVRHPMAPLWPLEVYCEQDFIADGDETVLKSRSWAINANEAEVAVYKAGFAGMAVGFAGTLGQLDAYLARS